MLQRAASNAYSWWWASHIRTKQSKWMEHNLQDMEEKVSNMLKIIDEDGDSFAKRAEMYYRKRPELINFVEESYRAYRALAERYDHISKELQNANRTIATVYPEQVQFAMDDEEEENFPGKLNSSHDSHDKPGKGFPPIPKPKIPKIPKKEFKPAPTFLSRKGQHKRTSSSAKVPMSSGLSKAEALEEIDKLQKGILGLQTEKEFVKSSYETGLSKCWEIENQITDMQGRVCSLQDEFGIGTVIDDDEARKLMAATALKSCQETLFRLQEKQEQSAEEAKLEYQRIKEAHEKFETFREQFLEKQTDNKQETLEEEHESVSISADPEVNQLENLVESLEQDRLEMESLQEKIKENLELDSNSPFTATELAEKIDELVNKVITLETAVSSQTALVKRLQSETDELHAHIRGLEDDKETLIEGSDDMSIKLRKLEEELQRVRNLNQSVEDQNHNLQTHFTEATCNFDHLSEKVENVKPDEEGENAGFFQELKAVPDMEPGKESEEQEDRPAQAGSGSTISKDLETDTEEGKNGVQDFSNLPKAKDKEEKEEEKVGRSNLSSTVDVVSEEIKEIEQHKKEETQKMSESVGGDLNIEPQELGMEEQEEEPNWKLLFLNGLEDREKTLLDEYTSSLRNIKEVKKKLSDVEKKNRESVFETTMHIRELKNTNAQKDEEIQSLRQKLSSLQSNPDENLDTTLTEHKDSEQEGANEIVTKETSPKVSKLPSQNSNQKPLYVLLHHEKWKEQRNMNNSPPTVKNEEWKEQRSTNNSPTTEVAETAPKIILVEEPRRISAMEEKLRTGIDELLEENLEFWLRFSTSFHQIQKFQNSIHDLQGELSRMIDNKQEGSGRPSQSQKSDARPIYKHMREIQTELRLWFEHNSLLEDELHARFVCLCDLQEEISKISSAGSGSSEEERDLSDYQAAKFQGEVQNMKQEFNKVADEMQLGLRRVSGMKNEIESALSKMDKDFGFSGSKHSLSRTRIPLRSFLFGVRLKKQNQKPSLFACMNPALQKQYSDLTSGLPPDSNSQHNR